VRQVTRESMDCRSPIYQSGIYTLAINDPWYQIAFTGIRPDDSSLYSVKLDGAGLRRLTYNPFSDAEPFLAPDGRILFSGGQPERISIFGVNLDGTDFALFSGPEGKPLKRTPCITTRRLAVFVEPDARGEAAGTLASVSLRRNLHSYRRLTAPAEGRFLAPAPAKDGQVLVSRIRSGDSFGIHRFNPDTRRTELIYDNPEYHDIQARLIAPREEPDGRASVVDETEPTGVLYCLSVYTNDLESPEWMPPGTARRVRVLEAVSPKREARFLGEVAIEDDGSFNLRTPANIPIRVQVLDADGMALRSSAWIWNKNKENRGCIGCHEDGELTPENRFAQALARPSIPLTLPPDRRRTVDFRRDVQPLIAKKCSTSGCHAGPRSLDLASLVTPGAARTSPLVWYIFGRNTSRPWDRVTAPARIQPMPPEGSPALTQDEKRTIIEWIDLGAHGRGGSQ
jgi:Hydrazine synthase alpha subunit middle domain/WD40-like Beta Propeller Repeat